jgi:hypothetical protein
MELGNTSNVKWFSGIDEYVIDWGPGYRIYLAKDGDALIMLFGGGTKRWQQAHIERAKALHAEYKASVARDRRRGDVIAYAVRPDAGADCSFEPMPCTGPADAARNGPRDPEHLRRSPCEKSSVLRRRVLHE